MAKRKNVLFLIISHEYLVHITSYCYCGGNMAGCLLEARTCSGCRILLPQNMVPSPDTLGTPNTNFYIMEQNLIYFFA